jgi:hypothetical protein
MAYTNKEIETIFNLIIQRIEGGEALRNILKDSDMPSTQTFYIWLEYNELLFKKYIKSITLEKYIVNTRCRANPKGSKATEINDYRRLNARKVNSAKFPKSNLYIIKIVDSDLYKIGVSQNIARRHKDIENAMPFNIEVLKVSMITNAYDLEDLLHTRFAEKFIKSEWFKLNDKDYKNCLKIIDKWQDQ